MGSCGGHMVVVPVIESSDGVCWASEQNLDFQVHAPKRYFAILRFARGSTDHAIHNFTVVLDLYGGRDLV